MDVSGNGNRKKLLKPNIVICKIYFFIQICMGYVTFTNLNCSSYNLDYLSFPTCQIKAVNRTHKYINIHAKIYKFPIAESWVSWDSINILISY